MTNKQRIKQLEHELGRYQKKVGDQAKEAAKLRDELKTATEAAGQMAMSFDAALIQSALSCGEKIHDEESGDFIGWRLEIPKIKPRELKEKYKVSAWADEEILHIGVEEKR